MTDGRAALAELLGKGSDSDLRREMIGYVTRRLMQMDVEGLVGAAHRERGEGREIGAAATTIAGAVNVAIGRLPPWSATFPTKRRSAACLGRCRWRRTTSTRSGSAT